jgi:hypothetical protein
MTAAKHAGDAAMGGPNGFSNSREVGYPTKGQQRQNISTHWASYVQTWRYSASFEFANADVRRIDVRSNFNAATRYCFGSLVGKLVSFL